MVGGDFSMYDLAIVGDGVIGCALAYTLSSLDLSVVLIEKENDVAMGASRANTAIIHAGFDPAPEAKMGQLNVEGMRRCYELCQELDVEHRRTGSLVVAFDATQETGLDVLYRQGMENGCQGLGLISGEKARQLEPNLSPRVIAALWAPEAGVINPWEFALAMAEVAVRNGVTFMPNTEVSGLEWQGDHYLIRTVPPARDMIQARYLVNASGVDSDRIHEMVAEPAFQIVPTRGQ